MGSACVVHFCWIWVKVGMYDASTSTLSQHPMWTYLFTFSYEPTWSNHLLEYAFSKVLKFIEQWIS